jgi:nucleotide sugar dehydrogenase
VAVVGSGYVGAVAAACLASLGREVVALEIDHDKLATLQRGTLPFFEAGADDLVRQGMESGALRFTSDVADAVASADVIFLCVGTPGSTHGHADVTDLASAVRAIGGVMDMPKVLVTKSTVPMGSGRWLQEIIEDSLSAPVAFSVVSNPEFLRQGSAVQDFLFPERIVLGSEDDDALQAVVEVYRPILDQSFEGASSRRPELVCTDLATAEMVKFASNAFLALKVSYANEVANICELVGADITQVTHALGLDDRIGPRFLNAGVGWGGSCFGKDLGELIAAAADHGYDAQLLRATRDVNQWQRDLIVNKLRRHLHGLRGRRIGLLGLAFKPGTDDLRDAPAIYVARKLLDEGATVIAHDPVVQQVPDLEGLRYADDPYHVADRADAVVLLTEWPEFSELELAVVRDRMRGRLLLDGRNIFEPAKVAAAGLSYEGVGRSAS